MVNFLQLEMVALWKSMLVIGWPASAHVALASDLYQTPVIVLAILCIKSLIGVLSSKLMTCPVNASSL